MTEKGLTISQKWDNSMILVNSSEKKQTVAKSYAETIKKYILPEDAKKRLTFNENVVKYNLSYLSKGNPYHDKNGKFSSESGVSASGPNKFLKGFSKQNLSVHWFTHKDEYPGLSKKEYSERALSLIQKATDKNVLGYKTADGKVVRYDKKQNDIVMGKPQDGISTMFKPHSKEKYYKSQRDRDGGVESDG